MSTRGSSRLNIRLHIVCAADSWMSREARKRNRRVEIAGRSVALPLWLYSPNNLVQNAAEVNAVVHIARRYTKEGKTYRVITPYDGQRNMLENALKTAKLPWENCCFNVDAFQGTQILFEPFFMFSITFAKETRKIISSSVSFAPMVQGSSRTNGEWTWCSPDANRAWLSVAANHSCPRERLSQL